MILFKIYYFIRLYSDIRSKSDIYTGTQDEAKNVLYYEQQQQQKKYIWKTSTVYI